MFLCDLQVSLPHFRDSLFLADAVRRYKQYLLLKRRHPDNFLVPCYDMDVVWHTHQLQPVAYAEDTAALLGQMLDHDDSVNDRAAGSKLCNSQQVTEKLWKGTTIVFSFLPTLLVISSMNDKTDKTCRM